MQENLFQSVSCNDFLALSKDELLRFYKVQRALFDQLEQQNAELKKYSQELEDKLVLINGQLVRLKNRLFKKSSEKQPLAPRAPRSPAATNEPKKKKTLLPSERYPEAPLIEREIELEELPGCPCCGDAMQDSGMSEDSEYLTVNPAQYLVIRQKRKKYRCKKCHGAIVTAPGPARIVPGSTYSDEMIIDVAMSKYCDLIPIERYSTIAGREGLHDLPPQSLIGVVHNFAEFIESAHEKNREQVCQSLVIHADETPHRMLEGDKKKNWFLWEFSTAEACYFELRDTRAGGVASEFLKNSACQYLVSDVFSGYQKAVKETNLKRAAAGLPAITNIYCNSHARRKFNESIDDFPEESAYFLVRYGQIYHLESQGRKDSSLLAAKRQEMHPIFQEMKDRAIAIKDGYSSKSAIVRAINYFLAIFDSLILFINDLALPIDNNHAERLLRDSVIGRKTWFGTHSKRGAKTAAIILSLVGSCKLNKVNPREYFKALVDKLHAGGPAFTPYEYKIGLPN